MTHEITLVNMEECSVCGELIPLDLIYNCDYCGEPICINCVCPCIEKHNNQVVDKAFEDNDDDNRTTSLDTGARRKEGVEINWVDISKLLQPPTNENTLDT